MSHLDIMSVCTGCGLMAKGRLYFDEKMKLVDSDGGVAFMDGWRCHNCLGEPYSSSDVVL